MKRRDERRLMRFLDGELPAAEAERLERRLAANEGLRRRLEELRQLWQADLETALAPVAEKEAAAADVWPRLRARLVGRRRGDLRWSAAPAWVRAGAAGALAAGILLGVVAGVSAPAGESFAVDLERLESTFAESYWMGIESDRGDEVPE